MPLSDLRERLNAKSAGSYRPRHPLMWYAGQWDAPVYAAVIGIGVPVMGILAPGDARWKLIVLSVWLAITSLYWWIELMEIVTEIRRDGLLDIQMRNHQKLGMQLLYWGVAIAIVIWGIFWAFSVNNPTQFAPKYGWIEWFVLAHTVLVARLSTTTIYPMIDNYLQATAGQRRVEQEEHH